MTDAKINLTQPHLNHLLEGYGAVGLILLSGDKVLGSAGLLDGNVSKILIPALNHYWPVSIARDLTRYVGLSIDGEDRFLSAKYFPESDVLLGLLFPVKTSLCLIRQDLTIIMDELRSTEPAKHEFQDALEQSLQILLKDYPAPDPDRMLGPPPSADDIRDKKMTEDINEAAFTEDQPIQPDDQSTIIENEPRTLTDGEPVIAEEPIQVEEGIEEIDLAMEDIPWQPVEDLMPPEEEIITRQEDEPLEEERHKFGDQRSAWQPLEDHDQQEDDLVSILQEDFTSVKDLTPADDIGLPLEDLPDPLETESLSSRDEDSDSIMVEAESGEWQPVVTDITFYLVPRLKRHFLVKELPHELRRWIPEICEIYGWQLDALSVRPDYLKWTLRDFPESLVRKMLRIIRRETSQRIFDAFPNLRHGNPTEDFWSQSYLVDRENLEISTQALIAHVAKERLNN